MEAGERIVGKKVGLTSKAVQEQLGVDEPDFGVLFQGMEYLDGEEISFSSLVQPRAEAEVAFVVSRDMEGDKPTYGEFLSSLAYALPAIEIVDSVIYDWRLSLADTVADNASCGVYVLGDQPISVGALSLANIGLRMDRNGRTESVGAGAACLGHPLRAAYWLARTMAHRGKGLKAGEVILSGALGPMIPLAHGDVLNAFIGELGSVSCRLV